MALKDLVADQRQLNEETIEAIVSKYIRYDPAVSSIIFTPEGGGLGNEPRLLVYLVAVLGWKYVVEVPVSVSTKPSDLESALGISGGTLRPLLKKLKDAHLVVTTNGNYAVQTANLDAVGRIISGEKVKASKARNSRSKEKTTIAAKSDKVTEKGTNEKKKKKNAGDLRTTLTGWIKDGFFDEPKTIKDLLNRYHEHAVIVKQTSLSALLLRAVREGALSRSRVESNGKMVWGYSKKNR